MEYSDLYVWSLDGVSLILSTLLSFNAFSFWLFVRLHISKDLTLMINIFLLHHEPLEALHFLFVIFDYSFLIFLFD